LSSDDEYLKKMRAHIAETRFFFGPKMKPERERSVCRAFVRCLGLDFSEAEIIASKTEPVDVEFRTARFQIRELLDPSRKRGDELKETQRKYENATSIEDLATPYEPSRPWSIGRLGAEVTKALQEKAEKYGNGCQDLDALVYVDLQNQHLNAKSIFADMTPLKTQGWRSVSVIFAPCSIVFFANANAPDFLQKHAGQVLSCWQEWDSLFDP
jgi:Putative endonuclease, protein of unknown function (DUF1780)